MKKAAHNARLKNLTDRILQLCASNGVSLAWELDANSPPESDGGFTFIQHDKAWDKRLRGASDETNARSKQDELTEAARQGFGPDVSEGRAE